MIQKRTVVIIGGVAGGASAAARLRRLEEETEIIVFERSGYVSFANCGLPYHLSDTISSREDLLLQTPQTLWEQFRLDVRVRHEVTRIDPTKQTITVTDLETGRTYTQHFDALVLSPGASPIVPPIPGADQGKVLRTIEDLDQLKAQTVQARDIIIVGGGFIGLEAAENLSNDNTQVTIIELGDQVLGPLDPEMAAPVQAELTANQVQVELGTQVVSVERGKVTLADTRTFKADLVLFAIGVRPDTALATGCGLRIGPRGGIAVDAQMRTSDPNIWAVGDAVEKVDLNGNGTVLTPLANIANREGRRAADAIAGRSGQVRPSQGTAIVRVFDLDAATTGWNEKQLKATDTPYLAIHTHPPHHAGYYPGAEQLALKLLIAPEDGQILGAQAVGRAGVDKRIDVLATAMRTILTAPELIDLELAYAPQFGSAKDPINQLGYIAENRISGQTDSIDVTELPTYQDDDWETLDVRTPQEIAKGALPGSIHIPLNQLRERISELDDHKVIVYCAGGQRSHTAATILHAHQIQVKELDGGWHTYQAHHLSQ